MRKRRRERKREKDRERLEEKIHPMYKQCPYCGGQMTWCNFCKVYSEDCHVPYGTCQCS